MTNPRKSRQRGKANQYALAKRLRMENIGLLGGNDLRGRGWEGEVKEFKKFPRSLQKSWTQVLDNLRDKDGHILDYYYQPFVIWHELNQRRDNDIVMLRLREFEQLIGGGDVQ